jgi:hypothetical membrane protein
MNRTYLEMDIRRPHDFSNQGPEAEASMISRSSRDLKFLRFAGFCGILGSTAPLIMILLSTFLAKWFRWDSNALSDLGVSEQALLFNSAVLLGGLLDFCFAVGLSRSLSKSMLSKAGVLSIMASGVCLALVGVFTTDYLAMHAVVAIGYFFLAPVGFLLIGAGVKSAIRKVSVTCGIGAFFAILVLPILAATLPFKIGFAIPELAESLVISAWTIFISTRLIRQNRGTQDATSA